MPHSIPDFRRRAQLTELMDEPCSREEMRACLRDLAWTNSVTLAYRPLLHWLRAQTPALSNLREPLRILDVACGYGDTLRKIERWASSHHIAVELTGLDLNPDTIAIAAEASPSSSRIQWVSADIFSFAPRTSFHLIVSSLFTHHLVEEEVVRFLKWMENQAQIAWFISDLSRAPIPYHLFRVFSRLARLHRFVQHDGPVSIARAFQPQDWQRMCLAAALNDHDVVIQSFMPARLCVSRLKSQFRTQIA
jgi:SAM-dependent methyltransferase